jgi:dihydrofolate reductase
MALPDWMLKTRMFHMMTGRNGGSTAADDGFAERSMENIGAWIMGRNMFGPIRGPWPDDSWTGWWGPNPPYHTRCTCSPITRGRRSRWKAAPCSNS